MPKFTPKNKAKLKNLIKNKNIYLGDIDTSLVDDMSDDLFSRRDDLKGISNWNVHNGKTFYI